MIQPPPRSTRSDTLFPFTTLFRSAVMPSLAPMVARVSPAVVNISTFTHMRAQSPLLSDPFFRRFFNVPEGQLPQRRLEEQTSELQSLMRIPYAVYRLKKKITP